MGVKREKGSRLDASDSGIIEGTGSDDRLRGTNGDDHIIGGAGHDRLSGQQGDDVLVGGFGRDVLTGGPGSDSFLFVNGDNRTDFVRDFRDGDTIVLEGFGDATFEDLTIERFRNKLIISLGDDDIAYVATNDRSLDADAFVFTDDFIA